MARLGCLKRTAMRMVHRVLAPRRTTATTPLLTQSRDCGGLPQAFTTSAVAKPCRYIHVPGPITFKVNEWRVVLKSHIQNPYSKFIYNQPLRNNYSLGYLNDFSYAHLQLHCSVLPLCPRGIAACSILVPLQSWKASRHGYHTPWPG